VTIKKLLYSECIFLMISLCRMLGLVLVSCRLYRLVASTTFATLMVVLDVPTG